MFATFEFSTLENLASVIATMDALGWKLSHIDASAPSTPAPAPVSAPVVVASAPAQDVAPAREYEPTHDTVVRLVADGKYVSYTQPDGKYLGTSGIRKALNARLRKVATYDATRKAWAFKSAKSALAWCEAETVTANDAQEKTVSEMLLSADVITHHVALVTASEWNAQRERAQARKAKKA